MTFPEQALRVLGPIGQNERNLRDLGDHLERLVPFVGAGLSIPFGYPGWGDLLTKMTPDVKPLVDAYQYEEAAEAAYGKLGAEEFRKQLGAAFDEGKLPAKLSSAAALVAGLDAKLVITTNLDRVLERSFAQAKRPFESVLRGHELYEASGALQRRRHVLLKLHGDYADAEPVLTLSQYVRAYGSADPLTLEVPRLLQQALVSGAVLFLGCSLQTDRTVRVMERVVQGLGVEHFALLSAKEDTPERREQLRGWRIKPLFFAAGQYGKIEEFLACLVKSAVEPVAKLVHADRMILQGVLSSVPQLAQTSARQAIVRGALGGQPLSGELQKALPFLRWEEAPAVFASELLDKFNGKIAGPGVPALALIARAIEPLVEAEQQDALADLQRRMGWQA